MITRLEAHVRRCALGGRLRLLQRVMHRFQSHAAPENVIRVMRAVTDGVNSGVGRPAALIDNDAIVNVEPGIRRQFGIRHHANADHDQVCFDLVSICQIDSGDSSITAKAGNACR